MTKVDVVRSAVQVLGEQATAEQIIEFVRVRHGETIEARFLPIYRATVRGEEYSRQARESAAKIVAEAAGWAADTWVGNWVTAG